MATLVFFHAHPDDESIATGGSIARAVSEGHRTVVVFGTRGECGEVPEDFSLNGETLGEHREAEVAASMDALGVNRFEFLGYRDSGMEGEATNDDPSCFWQAELDEAADRLATILTEESADVITVYDDHGGYGHPDHIQVHRVGHAAARRARTPRVYEATMNRDHIRRLMEAVGELGEDAEGPDVGEGATFGSPEEIITTEVDVHEWIDEKKASMVAHASQIGEDSFFLKMPDEAFRAAFGTEWFIRTAGEPVNGDTWLVV